MQDNVFLVAVFYFFFLLQRTAKKGYKCHAYIHLIKYSEEQPGNIE
jgi:hypothetical protein